MSVCLQFSWWDDQVIATSPPTRTTTVGTAPTRPTASRLLLAAPADTMSGNVLQVAANVFEIMIVFFPFFQATNAFLSLSIAMGRGTARTTATRLRSCSQWQYNERSVRLTWELGWLQTSRDRGVSPSDNQRRPELHVHHQLHCRGSAPASGDSYSPWSWYRRCSWWCWLPWPAGCVASELGSRAGEVFDDEHLAGGEQGLWGAYMSHGKVIWDNIVSLAGVSHHISVFLVNNDR